MTAITFDTHKRVREAQGEAELATKRDIDDLRRDMREMAQRMVIKLSGLIVLAVGVVVTLDKIL